MTPGDVRADGAGGVGIGIGHVPEAVRQSRRGLRQGVVQNVRGADG